MKTIVIKNSNNLFEIDEAYDDDILAVINDLKILESNIVYFSAGESKIKEILVRREPFYSA